MGPESRSHFQAIIKKIQVYRAGKLKCAGCVMINSMTSIKSINEIALAGSYIPEGLMTSCTWDYVSPSPANRSYTMMLCCFVFFIPLAMILFCYLFMFLSIRQASRSELLTSPLGSLV